MCELIGEIPPSARVREQKQTTVLPLFLDEGSYPCLLMQCAQLIHWPELLAGVVGAVAAVLCDLPVMAAGAAQVAAAVMAAG